MPALDNPAPRFYTSPGSRLPHVRSFVSSPGTGPLDRHTEDRSVPPAGAHDGTPAPGQRFGHYTVHRLLGRGGMGEVCEAEERASGRRVALKLFNRPIGSPVERERFLREGQLAASISHPNSVYIFGTDEIEGIPIIAMELASAGTLKDAVNRGGPLPPTKAADAILQVIGGLEAAAAVGIRLAGADARRRGRRRGGLRWRSDPGGSPPRTRLAGSNRRNLSRAEVEARGGTLGAESCC